MTFFWFLNPKLDFKGSGPGPESGDQGPWAPNAAGLMFLTCAESVCSEEGGRGRGVTWEAMTWRKAKLERSYSYIY